MVNIHFSEFLKQMYIWERLKKEKGYTPHYWMYYSESEDLWKEVFPVGAEWDQLDDVYQFNWNFSNLEVVSHFPPSDKIGISSVEREAEEIITMKQMKMDWVPYIPLEDRKGISIVY
ncbi:hypothetical protein ACB092_07G172800 [Castanea dentata]